VQGGDFIRGDGTGSTCMARAFTRAFFYGHHFLFAFCSAEVFFLTVISFVPVHQAFTETNLTMKTFPYLIRLLAFCPWPTVAQIPMAVNSSSRVQKRTG
jgi:hypothetical protein